MLLPPLPIRDIPPDERPRERCLAAGPGVLSLRECLALVLGNGPPPLGSLGLAEALLDRPGPGMAGSERERALFTALENRGPAWLAELPGLGPAGRARLLAAFELGRRYAIHYHETRRPARPAEPRARIQDTILTAIPDSARLDPHEWLGFVPLHRTGEAGALCIVERGVRTHVNVDPVELFARLLALRPRGFVLVHNHPSGDPTPSVEDKDLTRRVAEVSRALGVRFFAHLIVAAQDQHWLSVTASAIDSARKT